MRVSRAATASAVAAALLVLSSGCAADTTKAREPMLSGGPAAESSNEPKQTSSPVPLVGSGYSAGSSSGTVITYSEPKGLGFIRPDGGGDALGFASADIVMDGYRTLEAGQRVRFEIDMNRKAPMAMRVTATEEP